MSNNAGTTVAHLVCDLRLSGFTEGLLLDNGGDCVMLQRSYGGRKRTNGEAGPMLQFVTQHEFWTAVVSYWMFSAAVSSMPDLTSTGNSGYQWLFSLPAHRRGLRHHGVRQQNPGIKDTGVCVGDSVSGRNNRLRRALHRPS